MVTVLCYCYVMSVLSVTFINISAISWRMPYVIQELLTFPDHLSSTSVISGVLVARFIVFCVMFCRSLFFLLSTFVWSLYCVSFFELRFLITPLGYWKGKAWTEITTKFYPFMFRSQLPKTRSLTQVLV
jgi:hypothetical protein